MESTTSSSSDGSGSRSSKSPTLLTVKPEPQETPLGRRTRSVEIVINEPDASSSRLVRPKTEPELLPVKQEHLAMAVNDEAALKSARNDYVREEMGAPALRPGGDRRPSPRPRGGRLIILDGSDEEAPAPIRLGNPWEGSIKDDTPTGGNGDDYYSAFYKLLDM
ncbi:hypothetical protein D1007_23227 [Hordeum vulgare]|nr:hypothetical protein D1007_23227 [Hordeum vulgare]